MASFREWTLPLLSLVLIVLTLFIFKGNVVSGLTNKQSVQPMIQPPVTSGEAKLSFSAPRVVVKVGSVGKVSVKIDTGREKVSSFEAHVLYDPNVLAIQELKQGDFLPGAVVLEKNVGNGELVLALGTVKPQAGQGTLFSFDLAGKKNGSSNLTFSEKTQIAASGKSQSVLGAVTGAVVRVE